MPGSAYLLEIIMASNWLLCFISFSIFVNVWTKNVEVFAYRICRRMSPMNSYHGCERPNSPEAMERSGIADQWSTLLGQFRWFQVDPLAIGMPKRWTRFSMGVLISYSTGCWPSSH